MNLLDKIKLIIEAKSFYVKKVYIPDFDLMSTYRRGCTGRMYEDEMSVEKWFMLHVSKWKRILKYARDGRTFRWVVWYI